jgi:hypothetical protein
MSKFTDAVEQGTEGLDYLSTGYASHDLCDECLEEQDDEGFFSWSSCDCCGSSLGGTRYAAHGRDKDGNLVHLDVCSDCLMYLANGDEPR